MNIAKALKIKNRLIGEISKLEEQISRENSRRNDNPSKVNVAELFAKLTETREKLVKLKSAICLASAPIVHLLSSLSEIKSHINWLRTIPTREGQEIAGFHSQNQPIGYIWTAYINREKLDQLIDEHQNEINRIQDEIDEFNAKTEVNISGI